MRKELHEYFSEAIRTFGCEVLTEKRISNVLSDIGALTDFYWTDTVVYAANKNGLISKLIKNKSSIEKLSSEEVKNMRTYYLHAMLFGLMYQNMWYHQLHILLVYYLNHLF